MDEDNMILVDDTRNAISTPYYAPPTRVPPSATVVRRPGVVVHGAAGVRPVITSAMPTAAMSVSTLPAVYPSPAPTMYAQAPAFFPPVSPFAPSFGAQSFGPSPFGSSAYGAWGPFGYPYGAQHSVLSRLGDISPATIVDVASRLIAALSPLPEPPSALGKDGDISVEDAVSYQEALAKHAKKDEQLRELGFALAALLRGDLRRGGQ